MIIGYQRLSNLLFSIDHVEISKFTDIKLENFMKFYIIFVKYIFKNEKSDRITSTRPQRKIFSTLLRATVKVLAPGRGKCDFH